MKRSPRYYAKQLLTSVLNKPSGLDELVSAFWHQVIVNKHFSWRQRIIQEISGLWHELSGQDKVEVSSVRELSEHERKDIAKSIKNITSHEVCITWQVKPHLLGGVIVTINDERYDMSFKGQLDQMYFKLSQ